MGSKYITVAYRDIKFHKEDLREKTEYCSDYALYEERQQILDEEEYSRLGFDLRMAFDTYAKKKFTLDQLREVTSILGLR